jgi:predicted nucleotidyltransferase
MIRPAQVRTLLDIVHAHFPLVEVRLFGSQARGDARNWSDVDIALVGEGPLEIGAILRLRDALEESDLPFRVDVVDWHRTAPGFREMLTATSIPLGS